MGASLVAQMVHYLPATRETWVWSLGWEELLKKRMTTYSSILAWRIPWTEEPGELQPIYIYIHIYTYTYIYIYTHTHTYTYIHIHTYIAVVVVLSLSCVQLFATPRTVACHLPLSSSIFRSLLKLMSIESVMLSNHLSLCCPLLLPSIFPSIRVFPMSQLFTSGG